MKRNRFAFTLIELLIVVAIIAILAAIAVPNFLEAQTRAKVSRTKADMRSISTGLEAYAIDHNNYPIPFDWQNLTPYNVPNELSTPVAYVTSVTSFIDIFAETNERIGKQYHRFGYINTFLFNTTHTPPLSPPASESDKNMLIEVAGKWRMDSYGPDRMIPPGYIWYYIWYTEPSYDPTNGTVSIGAIYRSQKDPEGIQK